MASDVRSSLQHNAELIRDGFSVSFSSPVANNDQYFPETKTFQGKLVGLLRSNWTQLQEKRIADLISVGWTDYSSWFLFDLKVSNGLGLIQANYGPPSIK